MVEIDPTESLLKKKKLLGGGSSIGGFGGSNSGQLEPFQGLDRRVATIIVATDGTGDVASIQEAINELPSTGGVIYVKEGTYNIVRTIDINKSNVSIIGSGRSTVVQIASSGFLDTDHRVFSATSKTGIAISHMRLVCDRDGFSTDQLIYLNGCTKSFVHDCWTDRASFGIYLQSCSDCNIINNFNLSSTQLESIHLQSSDNCAIANNNITGCTQGIGMTSGTGNIVTGNVITSVTYGIYTTSTTNSTIDGNQVTTATKGIYVDGATDITVQNNILISAPIDDSGTDSRISHNYTNSASESHEPFTASGAINMNSNLINNVTDPVSAQDAATKKYVDDTIATKSASTSTDNAIARFDGTSGDIQNSTTFIDDSGRLGLATSDIEAWHSVLPGIIEGVGSSIAFGSGTEIHLNDNAYYDGSWKYKTSSNAGNLYLDNATFGFRIAGSGTINNTISWTQVALIDTNGLTLQNGTSVNEFSTDGTMAGNSDDAVPTEKAVVTYEGVNHLNSEVWVGTGNGYGSTNTKIRRFTNTIRNTGSDITYADSATLGASFTINKAGIYTMTFIDLTGTASDMGISVNSNQLTTGISAITQSHRVAYSYLGNGSDGGYQCATATLSLAVNNVVRAHTNGGSTATTAVVSMQVTRVN